MEGAFGVPPTTNPGVAKNGVFAYVNGIIGHNDVGGNVEGDAGTGVTGAAAGDEGLDASLRFASWSST